MPESTLLFAVATALLLVYVVLTARRHQREIGELRAEIDDLENRNRRLQDERRSLGEELSRARADLEELLERNRVLQTENADLERKRMALEETAARLERARAELEASFNALRSEHAALEGRVLEFQGAWSHQMTTLEEEIATLGRQLGEFRKGTRLPIPDSERGAALEPDVPRGRA